VQNSYLESKGTILLEKHPNKLKQFYASKSGTKHTLSTIEIDHFTEMGFTEK